jgi:thioredoxin 1
MNSRQVIELDYENFEDEVFGNDQPVLVEFWSETSYACRELSGIIDDVAEHYAGKVTVGRLNVEVNWQTAERFDVRSTPMVLLFQNDRVVDRIDGVKNRDEYEQALNELVARYWVI